VSAARISRSTGRENADAASSNHRVDVSGVVVDGDRVVHRRLGADNWDVGSHGHGLLAAVIDDGVVGEATHLSTGPGQWAPREWRARGGGRRRRGQQSGPRLSTGSRMAHAWSLGPRGAQAWSTGCAWNMRGRRGHAWRRNKRERRRGGRAWCGQWRMVERLGWRGNRIGLKEGVEIGGWGGASKGKQLRRKRRDG
jgi:hypothetical protein